MLARKANSFHFKVAALSMVLVSESISSTLVLPFVGLFVAKLQNISPDAAGFLSGILMSVFQLGQILTGKMWGRMSDRFGRRPIIQLGLFFSAVIAVFFGVSPNIEFCILMRFLHGCVNGNVLVAKTVIADITDKTTESFGFATICLFWGVGSIVGPTLGGLLYDPVQNPTLKQFFAPESATADFFTVHPASLPMLMIAAFSVLALLSTCILLPETSKNAVDPLLSLCCSRRGTTVQLVEEVMEGRESQDEEDSPTLTFFEEPDGVAREEELQQREASSGGAMSVEEGSPQPSVTLEGVSMVKRMRNRKSEPLLEGQNDKENKSHSTFGYREALQTSNTQLVLIMYMCIASSECAMLEVVPLWSIASVKKGGLGLQSSDVGWLMCLASIVCVIANLSFGFLSRCLQNNRIIWDASIIVWSLTTVALPCAIFFPPKLIYTCVALINAIREVALSWNFALIYLFIARSAPEEHMGSMNGVAQSAGSLSRMLTMLAIPPIFACSLSSTYSFPFNHHCVFWLNALPLLLSYVLSTYLSPSILSG
ncbi:putative transporter [Trypanosoma conorhini]|uniref:Putative transporter n=1 Tax=Trypanosoma conorhini TaxID=83891 RepID=A0A422Q0R6_9TRYP|nr:putative transporter [Trypanosoma conorhini]RNF23297.1 putative transporter [Trypanosoma conorhini]